MVFRVKLSTLAIAWVVFGPASIVPVLAASARIVKEGDSWQLLCDGKPFYIQGAVGWDHLDVLRASGGNTVRTRAGRRAFDTAASHQLKVMAGLPVRGERDGMDWGDADRVEEQKRTVLKSVAELKDHPAVLLWVIGNELDWIPPGKPHHPLLWERLDDLAVAIHEIDPEHPVLTVVGTGSFAKKIQDIAKAMPHIDLLGINSYGDLDDVLDLTRRYWSRPYVVAEWGPTGHWQVPKTSWSAPLEQTSTEKAEGIGRRYHKTIKADKANCLGSFVFLWGEKQETTHTWYGMFQGDLRSESVDVMQQAWTGMWPQNRAPAIEKLAVNDLPYPEPVILQTGRRYSASVRCQDPDGDPLVYQWDIRPEVEIPDDSYAGNREQAAEVLSGLIADPGKPEIKFVTSLSPGHYRLFVRILDGHEHVAYANVPFLVR